VTQSSENNIDIDKLEIQITELLRLELEIQGDIERQERDLVRVQQQRELLQTQVRLIKQRQLGREKD
jgi:hypothetical protein